MTLYDMLDVTYYDQEVWIYETNAFGQNMPLFKGTVSEARVNEDKVWSWLMCQVEMYMCKTGILVILVKDDRFEERLEEHYLSSVNWTDANRPWKYSREIDEELRGGSVQ